MKSSMKSSVISVRVASLAAFGLVLALAVVCRCAQASASNGELSESSSMVEPRGQSGSDLTAAAGHHYGKSHDGGKYYMYAEVPKKGAYKMGFKRGNEKHMIERKESVHKSHVDSYFKWHDKKGKGSHKFEFKHGDSKHYHY